MKERLRSRHISTKMIIPMTITLGILLIAYSIFYIYRIRDNALERYKKQCETSVQTSAKNIDHYFLTYISAAKSVYANRSLLFALMNESHSLPTGEERTEILNYLRGISHAVPSAAQIYLALPEAGLSYLYIPSDLVFSASALKYQLPLDELPDSYLDVYFQQTHIISSYGHIFNFGHLSASKEQVFTLWIPIANIPYSTDNKGYIAIDIPISFLVNNCEPFSDSENVFLVSEDGIVLASNIDDAIGTDIMLNLPDVKWAEAGTYSDQNNLTIVERFDASYISGTLIKNIPRSAILDTAWDNAIVLLNVLIFIFIALLIFNIASVRRYMQPLAQLTEYMQNIRTMPQDEHFESASSRIHYHEKDEIGTMISTFDEMLNTIRKQEQYQRRLMEMNLDSTMKMFQAQINPHFIYNTIQYFATSALKKQDFEHYSLLTSFGQMMHYSMVFEPSSTLLNQEIEYIRRYISLEQARYHEALTLDIQIEPTAEKTEIPKMTIQPLVENSIKHGRLCRHENGYLRITARTEDNWLSISIEDNGVPVSEEQILTLKNEFQHIRNMLSAYQVIGDDPQPPSFIHEESTSIGLRNVFSRLYLHFGECEMNLLKNDLGGTTVTFQVPLMNRKELKNTMLF